MSRTIDGRIWPEADDATNHKAKTQQSFAVSSGGRQARDWVQELVTIMGELGPWTRTVIDMEHVHYVDALGEKALHWLNRIGARFIARNSYCWACVIDWNCTA